MCMCVFVCVCVCSVQYDGPSTQCFFTTKDAIFGTRIIKIIVNLRRARTARCTDELFGYPIPPSAYPESIHVPSIRLHVAAVWIVRHAYHTK